MNRGFEKIKNIINLTGHNIRIFLSSGETIDIPPHVDEKGMTQKIDVPVFLEEIGKIKYGDKEIPIREKKFFGIEEINKKYPEKSDTIYIVSSTVASLIPRIDFYVINEIVKDPVNKSILGVRSLMPNPFILRG